MDGIRFGTGGWRATLDEFTDERIRMVGQAVATYLRETEPENERPVAVGYDARVRSEEAAESLADVLSANGYDVLLTDRDLPTPLVAHAIADRGLVGGLVVTASHNPPDYNGIKFIPASTQSPLPHVTEAIESHLAESSSLPEDERGTIERFDPAPAHASRSVDIVGRYVDVDLSELTVVYDAMHGSGRGVTDRLLAEAGVTVIRRRCDHDPTFGGTAPEPSPETLSGLVEAVAEKGADLGIANDGDADRISLVTPERGVLSGNLLFAGLYDALLGDGDATGPAIRTVSTTFLIDRIAEAHGEDVFEVPVGFKWIAGGMAEHGALFGGEESGGFTIEEHIGEKDGVLVALLAGAVSVRESFDARLDRLFETHGRIHADKCSVACPEERKAGVIASLGDAIPETVAGIPVAETNSLDGFKLLLDDGSWILVRPSGTEPKMRVYAESTDPDLLGRLREAGRGMVAPLVETVD